MSILETTREEIRQIAAGSGKICRWIARHLDYAEKDWCLIFPFGWEEGHYPKFRCYQNGKRNYFVHRLMCAYRHGPPPSPEHHSAHSCDRGSEGCVNPMHVSWKTASQNQADRYKAGGYFQRERLTLDAVAEIKRLQSSVPPSELARRFGTTSRNIRLIFAGQSWKDPDSKARMFTPDEVIAIRGLRGSISPADIAKQYGASRTQIYRIFDGRSYGWVKDPFAGAPHG